MITDKQLDAAEVLAAKLVALILQDKELTTAEMVLHLTTRLTDPDHIKMLLNLADKHQPIKGFYHRP